MMGFLEGIPDEVAVFQLEMQIFAQFLNQGTGLPGQLEHCVLQGMDHNLLLH